MKLFARLFIRKPELKDLAPAQAGEAWVGYLYRLKGWRILARNYTLYATRKMGELDLICQKDRALRIVEVRTRSHESFMNIEDSLNFRKQNFLRRMAKLFLLKHPEFQEYELQIDLAAVLWNPVDKMVKDVRLIENAIEDRQ